MDKFIDLNADIGEASSPQWAAHETAILDYVSSANIACGGHAGDMQTMMNTAAAAQGRGVNIGAHPAYPDRKNFGRLPLKLGEDINPKALSESLYEQISRMMDAAKGAVKYVKPHGALYNQAAENAQLADLIGDAVLRIDHALGWLGAPRSAMTQAAKARGISFTAEAFIDRRYDDQGYLTARTQDGAIIETNDARIAQALNLAQDQSVVSIGGKTISIKARSLCVHGDSQGAVKTARLTRKALEKSGFHIKAFT